MSLLIKRTIFAQIEEEVDVRCPTTVIPRQRRDVGSRWEIPGLGTAVELALDGDLVAIDDLGYQNVFVSIPNLFTVRLLFYKKSGALDHVLVGLDSQRFVIRGYRRLEFTARA
jgi:hypothetical protein